MSMKTAPSRPFTREELRRYALEGAASKVRAMELELARLHREFPSVFASKEPPVFAAPQVREDGRELPLRITAPDQKRSAAMRAAWTPARRKKAAREMKKRSRAMFAARMEKKTRTASGKVKSEKVPVWQQVATLLAAREEHRATSKEIKEALGLKHDSAIADAFNRHPEIFRRPEVGVYALTAAGVRTTANGTGAEA